MAVIEINHHPSSREFRWFGLLLLVFAGVLGSLLRWQWDLPTAARVVWGLGAAIGAIYAVIPQVRKAAPAGAGNTLFVPPTPVARGGTSPSSFSATWLRRYADTTSSFINPL